MFKKERLKEGLKFKKSIVVVNTGFYCFEFDNSYSWIKGKEIKYRCNIFSTMDIEYIE